MKNASDATWLTQAARRLENSPEFVASRLYPFLKQAGLSEQQVAAMLGCSEQQVVKLALCRWLDDPQPNFRSYVERLSRYLGVEIGPLANLLRQLSFVSSVRQQTPQQHPGLLIAAREREDPNNE